MADKARDILGLVLSSDSPVFLSLILIHVAAGILCVVAGAMAMLVKKSHRSHPRWGSFYFWSLSVVFVTCIGLSILRWPLDNSLLVLGILSFAMAVLGRTAHRKLQPGWARWHLVGMSGSYIFLLTAFYVDNGPNLPLWKLLPPLWFWILPGLIGIPLMVVAFLRNPLTRMK